MSSAWAVASARKIGHRAGQLAAVTGHPRSNPFTGKAGLEDLAAAWQHGYDRAVHPSGGALREE